MVAVSPNSSPPLWALTFDNQPVDANQCLAAMEFLAEHPSQEPEWNKRCAELLATTSLSSMPEAAKTQSTLFEKFPNLFDCIIVKMGGQERQIPKARLKLLSEKFVHQLGDRWNTNALDFGAEEASIANQFLDYLATGKLDITGENVTSLFTIADQQGVSSLMGACFTFLEQNLNIDSFHDILKHAIEIDHFDLFWLCLVCFSNNPAMAAQLPQPSYEASLINNLLPGLNNNLSFSWANGVRTLTIKNMAKLSPQTIEALKALHRSCPIRGLVITQARNLRSLNFIKTLDVVEIGTDDSDTKAAIPKSWLQSAKIIRCTQCTALTTLDAPHAIEVKCPSCTSLTTLNAPNASSVDCWECTSLKTLNAPRATTIDCECCPSLETLDTPKATCIDCSSCISLTNLNVPKATEVFCNSCRSLATLNAPKATKINCKNCKSLTTIRAAQGCIIMRR